MPAARLGPENPLPPLAIRRKGDAHRFDAAVPPEDRKYFGYGTDAGLLPHRLQDDYDRRRAPRAFKALVLENETLRAAFLPELGGRLWSLTHKPSGRELLYVNPVFQPANLAVRNAWFSGGVEWNIGVIGHTPSTCSPLFAARVRGEDASPILRLYEWDRIRQVPYQMDFSLPDGSPVLLARMRIVNPHEREVPMYWWSNIAVPERPDVRVLVPADKAFRHDYRSGFLFVPVPLWNGTDVTYATNFPSALDFFYYIPDGQRPWITALDGEGRGLFQASTARLRGRKLFVWGMGSGGRRWQEFLSLPGQAYMEIQAGLARTQYECLPMPPGADWSWLEAYGLMEADPRRVHGADWARAGEAVESQINRILPQDWLEEEHTRGARTADRPPEEILHRGSGWGALERRRRERAGERPFCPPALVFDDASLGGDQEPWLKLLEEGELPGRRPSELPGAWMVQDEWRQLLEGTVRRRRGEHWLSWLHLGVMRYHAGEWAAAQQAWERSLALEPSAWACRNLAVLAKGQERTDEGAARWRKACRMAPALLPLAVEAGRELVESGRAQEARELLALLPPDLQGHPRLKVIAAQAALGAGDLETIEGILMGKLELTDLREGENVLTELWFALQEKRLAAAENVPMDKTLRERVRREFPPPAHLDFRMSVSAPAESARPTGGGPCRSGRT